MRWLLRVGNGEAESGANVGSNFDLHRYADDGAHLGHALRFSRATGLGVVGGDPTEATGIATKNYVDVKDAALQVNIDTKQGALGFTPVQQSGGTISPNKVHIGWDNAGLRAQVDGTDLGRFFMELTIPRATSATVGWRSPAPSTSPPGPRARPTSPLPARS